MSEEKKVNETEETKVNETEEKHGVELTDEELSQVNAGLLVRDESDPEFFGDGFVGHSQKRSG